MASKNSQRGVALLTALMVLALASLLAFAILQQTQQMMERSAANERAAQANALADGLFEFALIALLRDGGASAMDHRGEIWAQPLPPLPVPQGVVTGRIEDLNGRININGFAAERADRRVFTRQVLSRLLTQLNLNPQLALRIEDAVDADETNAGGGEDIDFLGQRPSSRAPNRPLNQTAELRNLPGLSEQEFELIAPFISAIDPNAQINVNTASWQVLLSLDAAMNEDFAKKMWREGRAEFADKTAFVTELTQLGGPNLAASQAFIDVGSSHFIAHALVKLDEIEFHYKAQLNRKDLRVVWKAQGDF